MKKSGPGRFFYVLASDSKLIVEIELLDVK
jgi:hypothetical protein